MRTWKRTTVVGALTAVGLATGVTATLAALEDDGVHLRADWQNGGEAWLELEDRNVLPVICFIWAFWSGESEIRPRALMVLRVWGVASTGTVWTCPIIFIFICPPRTRSSIA